MKATVAAEQIEKCWIVWTNHCQIALELQLIVVELKTFYCYTRLPTPGLLHSVITQGSAHTNLRSTRTILGWTVYYLKPRIKFLTVHGQNPLYILFTVQCSGLAVVGTAMTIYLGTLRPLLPNSCFQPSLSLHSIVQTCIRSPTWIWGRYLLEKLTPLNLFPVKNQESFFNYAALECCIFYQTEQTIF